MPSADMSVAANTSAVHGVGHLGRMCVSDYATVLSHSMEHADGDGLHRRA